MTGLERLVPLVPVKFNLKNGPIDLRLADQELRIVDSMIGLGRIALENLNSSNSFFVIDPNQFSAERFQPVRDKDRFMLGRANPGKLKYNATVSNKHVIIIRDGSFITLVDCNSSNGTWAGREAAKLNLGFHHKESIVPRGYVGHHFETPSVKFRQDRGEALTFSAEAVCVPSEKYPEHNDDAILVDDHRGVFGVFDGVGGSPGSSVASNTAVEQIQQHFQRTDSAMLTDSAVVMLREALMNAHTAINKANPNIATTAAVVKMTRGVDGLPVAVVATVGDSRVYQIREGSIIAVTYDNAYMGDDFTDRDRELQKTLSNATDLTKLSPQEHQAFRARNIIGTQLGMAFQPYISLQQMSILKGDKLLVTSDGIHDNLTDDEIVGIVSQNSQSHTVKDLLKATIQRSRDRSHLRAKPDDMSAVLINF